MEKQLEQSLAEIAQCSAYGKTIQEALCYIDSLERSNQRLQARLRIYLTRPPRYAKEAK